MRIKYGKKSWNIGIIERRDWLLLIGLCLAPMTGLRIWKIGPAEVLCLLWGIKYIPKLLYSKSDTSKFFFLFIMALSIGSLIGYIVAPNELQISGLLTWIYLGIIAASICEGLRTKTLEYNEKLFSLFAELASAWYLFLYLYSNNVSRTFFGAPLWYASARFSGGGTNPHQVAVMLCGLCFVFVRKFLRRDRRVISLLGIALCVFLLLKTASSTGVLAIALSFAITLYFVVGEMFPKRKVLGFGLLTVALLIVGIIGATYFWTRFVAWIASDANGLGRLKIFSSYSITFAKSPLFGLGPGVHGQNGWIEYHNTYIEILAAAGLAGGVIFLDYSFRLFKKVLHADWRLFPIVVAMYAYGLAGFAMRRLVYWGIIGFISVIAEQMIGKRIENNSAL